MKSATPEKLYGSGNRIEIDSNDGYDRLFGRYGIRSKDICGHYKSLDDVGLLSYDNGLIKTIGEVYLPCYTKPKRSRSSEELDALEQYLLEVVQTNVEAITPVVIGERVVYIPNRLSGFPQDVRGLLEELKEEEIGVELEGKVIDNVNLRDALWDMLAHREYQMRMPIVDSRGGVAILVSNASNDGEPQEQLLYWHGLVGKFYYNLFRRLRYFDGVELGREPMLKIGATTEDLKKVLHDPNFSSIVTIGHGRYGVWSATDKATDWAHVEEYSHQAGHLKSGFWIHLSCLPTVAEEPLSGQIPFPYFAMRDPNNILGLLDGRGSNGLFYAEEYVGINGHETVEPVILRRIAKDSLLTKLEPWKKIFALAYNPGEVFSLLAIKLLQDSDPFYKKQATHLLEKSLKMKSVQN